MCRPVLSVTLTRSIYGLVKGEIFHAWPLRRLFVPTLVVVDLSSSFSWLLLSKIPCINICFNPLKRSMRRIGLSCLFQRLYRFTTKEELSTIHSRNILSTLDFQFKSKMIDYTNREMIFSEERKTRFCLETWYRSSHFPRSLITDNFIFPASIHERKRKRRRRKKSGTIERHQRFDWSIAF